MLFSAAFAQGEAIPVEYTADGADISPPLAWRAEVEPESYALVCEDPDAPGGTWVHWVVYDIPPEASGLDEGLPGEETLEDGTTQGENDWGETGYGGPAPPEGSGAHRYFFRLYALDAQLDLPPGLTADELYEAMGDHVMATAELMGTYSR